MTSPKTIWDEFKDHEFAHAYFDEHLNTFIATQIKVLREQRGLKQEELAKLAHMAQERICVLENVNYTSWTINTLRRIAKALGVRLRVSFETFSSGVTEMREFSQQNLVRASLDQELKELATVNASVVVHPPAGQVDLLGYAPTIAVNSVLAKQVESARQEPSATDTAQLQAARPSMRQQSRSILEEFLAPAEQYPNRARLSQYEPRVPS
jgi:transcriptional regulator with XRE-family HTH domain